MIPVELRMLVSRLEQEFPDYPLTIRPWCDPDDPAIDWFLDLLLVPREQLHEVALRAWEIAIDEFGDRSIPFHLTAVSPESSTRHFGAELEATLWREAMHVVALPLKARSLEPSLGCSWTASLDVVSAGDAGCSQVLTEYSMADAVLLPELLHVELAQQHSGREYSTTSEAGPGPEYAFAA